MGLNIRFYLSSPFNVIPVDAAGSNCHLPDASGFTHGHCFCNAVYLPDGIQRPFYSGTSPDILINICQVAYPVVLNFPTALLTRDGGIAFFI